MAQLFHYKPQGQAQVAIPHQATAAPPHIEGSGSGILKAALGAGAEALKFVAHDYNRYNTGLVEDAVSGVDRQFEEWKSEYMRTTQGKDASLAQRDFTQKYEQLTQEALKQYDFPQHTIYKEELQKKLAARGLMAFKDGGAYQRQQTQAWEKSVWEGGMAQFAQDIQTHADDPDRLEFLANEKLELWRQQNPGLDDSAIRLNLTRMVEEGRINQFLASGEYDKAQAVLGADPAQNMANMKVAQNGHSGAMGTAITKGMPQNVNNLIRAAAKKHGVPEELALAVAMQESGGNQASVSHAGAIGVMQLMPGTARDLGVNPHDLAQNIDGGVRYIAQMLKEQGGNVQHALFAYNWGNGNVAKWKQTGRGVKGQAMPREAQEYAARVLGRMTGGGAGAAQPGAMPQMPGSANPAIDPVRRMQYQAKIDAARRQQMEGVKAQASLQFADYKAQCLDGIIPDTPPNPENFAVFGSSAADKYLEAQAHYEYGAHWQIMKESPLASQAQLLEHFRPHEGQAGYAEKAALYQKLESAASRMRQELESDPVKWLVANDRKTARAREAFLTGGFTPESFGAYYFEAQAAQKARGVPEDNIRIFSKEDARLMGEKYAAMRDPSLATQQFEQAFGAMYGKAMQEIMPHMPAASAFMAGGMNPNAARLLMDINGEIKKDKSFLNNLYVNLNITGKDKTAFQKKIAEVAAPATSSFVGGVNDKYSTGVREETEKLALAYMRRGFAEEQAITKAYDDVIGGRYTFTGNPNAANLSIRIPASQSSPAVNQGFSAYLRAADLAGCSLLYAPHMSRPEQQKAFEDMVRGQGYFVTDSDESGCFLYVGESPVVDKQGNLIRIPWEVFAKMGNKYVENDPNLAPEMRLNYGGK